MNPAANIPVEFDVEVLSPLRRLSSRLMRRVAIMGACRCLAVLTALSAGQLAVDRLLALGRGPRAAMLAVILFLFARQVLIWIARPLMAYADPVQMAAVLEKRHAGLADRLISTVALATKPRRESADDSPAFILRLFTETIERYRAITRPAIFDERRLRRHLALGGATCLVIASSVTIIPGTLRTFLLRDWLIADVSWPLSTTLVVEGFKGGVLRWPIGDDLSLSAMAQGEIPDGIEAQIESGADRPSVHPMERRGERQFLLNFGPLSSNMRVRFILEQWGADPRTDWYAVHAVERPSIKRANVEVRPPAYTKQPPFALAAGQLSADILRGSAVAIKATVNKPVASATLKLGDASIAAANMDGPDQVGAEFTPERGGSYYFDLQDHEGFTDTRPVTYALRLLTDPAPQVRVAFAGAGEMLVPGAVLELTGQAEDNLALRAVDLITQVRRSAEAGETSATKERVESMPGVDDHPQRLTLKRAIALAPLQLAASDLLTLKVVAADFQNQTPTSATTQSTNKGRPGVGESQGRTFRIVTQEELLSELARRESEWCRQFEQIIKTQEQIKSRLDELGRLARVQSTEHAPRFAQEQRAQIAQSSRVTTVRRQFEMIFDELKINQLATTTARKRLEAGITIPLRDRVIAKMTESAALIDQLRGDFSPQRSSELESVQTQLIQAMYAVLANMLRSEGYNEAIALLRDIVRLQGEVTQQTQTRLNREIDRMFGAEPTSQPTSRSTTQP
jgi:hypothetical protein